jgi:hypothetical protein
VEQIQTLLHQILHKVVAFLGLFQTHQQLLLLLVARAGETLSAVGNEGVMIYVSNGYTGNAVYAFSDGTDLETNNYWHRHYSKLINYGALRGSFKI